MKVNYHTHTARCMHATGEDEEYVRHALKAGFEVLGFADHVPWPFASGYVSPIRMPMSEMEGYIASVTSLRERYAGQIDVRLGFEAEYFPRYRDHLLALRDRGVSFLVLGQHYCDSEEDTVYSGLECKRDDGVRRYAEATVNAMRTGLFLYVAHPDLMMRHRTDAEYNAACEEATDMICQAAAEMHLPLEYNLLGLDGVMHDASRGYPSTPFWERAKRWRNPVILGVDAHKPAMLSDSGLWEEGRRRVLEMGFRLLDDLEHDWSSDDRQHN